jgi:hypothetical protein
VSCFANAGIIYSCCCAQAHTRRHTQRAANAHTGIDTLCIHRTWPCKREGNNCFYRPRQQPCKHLKRQLLHLVLNTRRVQLGVKTRRGTLTRRRHTSRFMLDAMRGEQRDNFTPKMAITRTPHTNTHLSSIHELQNIAR